MSRMRYLDFCALARAAEVLGERWTLLIVRELLLGPARFVDLRRHLDGVSTSVLAERLARLEADGLVHRAALEPPAASTVYALTADGQALRPAVLELIRWGARRLLPAREGERLDPRWILLALQACARRGPSPPGAVDVRVVGDAGQQVLVRVEGGGDGTQVTASRGRAAAQATLVADPSTVLGLAAGLIDPDRALAAGAVQIEGGAEASALRLFPRLFDIPLSTPDEGGRNV